MEFALMVLAVGLLALAGICAALSFLTEPMIEDFHTDDPHTVMRLFRDFKRSARWTRRAVIFGGLGLIIVASHQLVSPNQILDFNP